MKATMLLVLVSILVMMSCTNAMPLGAGGELTRVGRSPKFEESDTNGDQLLSRTELETQFRRAFSGKNLRLPLKAFKEVFTHTNDAQKMELDMVALNADANSDGRLDTVELTKANADAILRLFDADGDGQISPSEYDALSAALYRDNEHTKNESGKAKKKN